MTAEEYERQKRDLIRRYTKEIDEHEGAGCYGDADNAREWLHRKLDMLESEYKESR